MNDVKFRGAVEPGHRVILIAKAVDLRPRRAIFDCQGFVDGTMVFEGQIVGMPM
jgi:3-hydroxyacyl-[acyl-carrier-protein] dehydratase